MKTKKLLTCAAVSLLAASVAAAGVSAAELPLAAAGEITSMTCFTYENDNNAWAHIWNPYNTASLFSVPADEAYDNDTKDLIIEFTVTGLEEPFSVMPGFQAHGDEDPAFAEELSVWNQDDYTKYGGAEYIYTIDQDGTYQVVVPFKALASGGLDFWGENLEKVGILEMCFYGVSNDDKTGFISDTLTIEFNAVYQSNVSHTVEECAFNGGEPVKFYENAEEAPEESEEPEDSEKDEGAEEVKTEESSNTNTTDNTVSTAENDVFPIVPVIIIAAVVVVAVIIIVIVVVSKKKK